MPVLPRKLYMYPLALNALLCSPARMLLRLSPGLYIPTQRIPYPCPVRCLRVPPCHLVLHTYPPVTFAGQCGLHGPSPLCLLVYDSVLILAMLDLSDVSVHVLVLLLTGLDHLSRMGMIMILCVRYPISPDRSTRTAIRN